MKMYVGNIPRNVSEDTLNDAFAVFGQVASTRIIADKFTGQSRGFAFVEMPNDQEAQAAIAGMNGKDFEGRTLTVNEARPREERPRGGRGFGGGGGRGGKKGGRGFGGGGSRSGGGRGGYGRF